MEQPPAAAGIQLANWYWKVVRQFVSERFGISLCRSSCLNWLHRLGFACKRPNLVVHQFWIDGYKDFNFMRASAVVKRQSTFMAS